MVRFRRALGRRKGASAPTPRRAQDQAGDEATVLSPATAARTALPMDSRAASWDGSRWSMRYSRTAATCPGAADMTASRPAWVRTALVRRPAPGRRFLTSNPRFSRRPATCDRRDNDAAVRAARALICISWPVSSERTESTMYSKKVSCDSRCMRASSAAGRLIMMEEVASQAARSRRSSQCGSTAGAESPASRAEAIEEDVRIRRVGVDGVLGPWGQGYRPALRTRSVGPTRCR